MFDFGNQTRQTALLLVLERIKAPIDGLVVCGFAARQVLMQPIGAVQEHLAVPAKLQVTIGKLHDVHRCTGFGRMALVTLDFQNNASKRQLPWRLDPDDMATLRCDETLSILEVARHRNAIVLTANTVAADPVRLNVLSALDSLGRFGLVTLAHRAGGASLAHPARVAGGLGGL